MACWCKLGEDGVDDGETREEEEGAGEEGSAGQLPETESLGR